jgi:hypothetical protein
LDQIPRQNKRITLDFLIGQHAFQGKEREKEKKKRKGRQSQTIDRTTTRALSFGRGHRNLSNITADG